MMPRPAMSAALELSKQDCQRLCLQHMQCPDKQFDPLIAGLIGGTIGLVIGAGTLYFVGKGKRR
jgi:hypothetical protein